MTRKQLTKKDINQIKKLHLDGMSFMNIAFKTKISFWTVKYHLDKKYRDSVRQNNLDRNREIAKKKILNSKIFRES